MAELTLPFHRKYRPRTLAEYVGNDRVKERSLNAVSASVRPQVLLYTGPAGCGKTTMARLMAKEYVCENRDPVKGACGECYYCREMDYFIETGDAGNLMNVQEIDVTDSNKRQDIDRLLEDASQPDLAGNWKVYILDECHMMTATAQNRLLKNLEEPAEKVLMILCTTNPEKLLDTILSRCQYTFKVKKPELQDLMGLLIRVCKTEGVEFDTKALNLVCIAGDFVPRKVLTSLERVVRQAGKVTYSVTREVLDMTSTKYFFDFYKYLLAPQIDIKGYITFIASIKATMDLGQFVDDLLAFTMRGLYIYSGVNTESLDESEIENYVKLFSQFSTADLGNTLATLLDIKFTGDHEVRLILLGYMGLRATVEPELSMSPQPVKDGGTTLQKRTRQRSEQAKNMAKMILENVTPGEEQTYGERLHQLRTTMSQAEFEQFIKQGTQLVGGDQLADTFQGMKVDPTRQVPNQSAPSVRDERLERSGFSGFPGV